MNLMTIDLPNALRMIAAIMVNEGQYAGRILELNNQLRDIQAEVELIANTAAGEGRDMTEKELEKTEDLLAGFEKIKNQVKTFEKMDNNAAFLREVPEDNNRPAPGGVDPQNTNRQHRHTPAPQDRGRIEVIDSLRESNGFRNFGEFGRAVLIASNKRVPVSEYDPRLLMNAPTTFAQESVGEDGGFLVPQEYRNTIMKQVMGEDSLLARCDDMTVGGNNITVPVDETTPWGAAGIQAYWDGEASQYTQSKPKFKDRSAKLHKLTALVPVSEEMLEDSNLIGSYLNGKAPEVITDKVNDAIVNGTGAGMPEGFMNSGALITVAKESGQAADTILSDNIFKMYNRMPAKRRGNSIWLINQDIETQLWGMTIEGTSSSVPAYLPAGGLSNSPFATLMGRPILPLEAMQTLGDLGDIALVDMSQYMAATKASGITSETSIHLWFDYDMVAFKFRFRLAGQTWFTAPITPKNSANTVSPFVTLAARA